MTAEPVDAGALLDGSPWTTYQKMLTVLVAAGIIVDGFDIQILAFSIPSLAADWQVPRSAFAPVLALGLVGMAVGGPFIGYFGDRFGRRPALIASIALFAVATLSTAFVSTIVPLAVLRFFTGFGAGGAVPSASALAAEFAPLLRRPVAVKLTVLCVPLGGMLGGFIASRVLPALGWRALYLIGGGLPLLLALVLWVLLPESPRFLAQSRDGWPRLAHFLSRAGHVVSRDAAFVLPTRPLTDRISFSELFSSGLGRDTTGLWIAFFFNLGGVYLIFGWLPAMLTSQGLSVSASSIGLATYNLGGVAGVLAWAVLNSLFGSRIPLLSASLCTSATAIFLWYLPARQGLTLSIAIAMQGLFANAVQTSLYALSAHVYPTRIRTLGVAVAATLGRIGGIVSSLTGSILISQGAGAYWGMLGAAMILAFIGLAIVQRHIPPPPHFHSKEPSQ